MRLSSQQKRLLYIGIGLLVGVAWTISYLGKVKTLALLVLLLVGLVYLIWSGRGYRVVKVWNKIRGIENED